MDAPVRANAESTTTLNAAIGPAIWLTSHAGTMFTSRVVLTEPGYSRPKGAARFSYSARPQSCSPLSALFQKSHTYCAASPPPP